MRIGVDIDNTITNTLPILKRYCQKYNDEEVKRGLQMKSNGWASYNLFDWTEEESMAFCVKYLEEVVLQAEVKPGAKENISRLSSEGHEIFIISARFSPMFRDPYGITERYLKEKGIVYDKLLVGMFNKKSHVEEYKFDVMIEDEPPQIEDISKIIPVIVFDYDFNKNCKGCNIVKVNTWDEVYNEIQNLSKF